MKATNLFHEQDVSDGLSSSSYQADQIFWKFNAFDNDSTSIRHHQGPQRSRNFEDIDSDSLSLAAWLQVSIWSRPDAKCQCVGDTIVLSWDRFTRNSASRVSLMISSTTCKVYPRTQKSFFLLKVTFARCPSPSLMPFERTHCFFKRRLVKRKVFGIFWIRRLGCCKEATELV